MDFCHLKKKCFKNVHLLIISHQRVWCMHVCVFFSTETKATPMTSKPKTCYMNSKFAYDALLGYSFSFSVLLRCVRITSSRQIVSCFGCPNKRETQTKKNIESEKKLSLSLSKTKNYIFNK